MTVAQGAKGADGESAAKEESTVEGEADSERDANIDFGQPRVTTTSVVPEVERRATKAAAELVDHEQQQQFSDTGESELEIN